jgi:phosphatidylglycerophosphate synthase
MDSPPIIDRPVVPPPRAWDARLARTLVTPLVGTAVTPNQLTTLRLAIGIAGAAGLAHGGYGWMNTGAFLIVLSNFVDHTDGELARITGQSSHWGHRYDLACDAVVTILLFVALGVGVSRPGGATIADGCVAGLSVALIFFLRMRIERMEGKAGTRQGFAAGFETEDVLYLLPLVTLFDVVAPFVVVAAMGSGLFAVWVVIDYLRMLRRQPRSGPTACSP